MGDTLSQTLATFNYCDTVFLEAAALIARLPAQFRGQGCTPVPFIARKPRPWHRAKSPSSRLLNEVVSDCLRGDDGFWLLTCGFFLERGTLFAVELFLLGGGGQSPE